jgi:hypothetical protein
VSRIAVNVAGHVQLFFVCALEKGLEFPAGQDKQTQQT